MAGMAQAQAPPGPPATRSHRSHPPRAHQSAAARPLPPPVPLPLPTPEPIPVPPEVETVRFPVDRIEVLGNTVLADEIAALVAPLEGRELSLEDLLDLRTAITNLYAANGYLTSGAFLPAGQDLSGRVVQIQVVEGSLAAIQVNGLTRLQPGYVRDRIALATQPR